MSRIWDALQKVEKLRDVESVAATALPDRMRLTDKQRVAIRALLRTSTIGEAASAAEVTEVTLRRWLSRPAFVAEYYTAGREEIESSMRRLDAATETAMGVLEQARDLMEAVRIRAERVGAAIQRESNDQHNGHGRREESDTLHNGANGSHVGNAPQFPDRLP